MTTEEAKKIIDIMYRADGECYYCGVDLVERFCKEFPEHENFAMKYFIDNYYPNRKTS